MKNLNLSNKVILSLEEMKIISPTEIQKKTIPLAMEGNDILASSQTGSGKTLAYLIPIIESYIKNKTLALILVPTRELAIQVNNTITKISNHIKLSNAILIGGESIYKQSQQLRSNPKIIVATPGRIIDHLVRKNLNLHTIKLLVLDEMDRMLDMGMKEQLEEINKYMIGSKQVLMFSATMPKHIIELSKKYLINPKRIEIGSVNKAAEQIVQETLYISNNEKFIELEKQIKDRSGSIIVFVKTKRSADEIAKMLKINNHKAEAIHGDLTQVKRNKVISSFRNSKNRIMVATDVAARGLDIPHTQHVINYDLPISPENYLHRIGRTGRAGAAGNALSFISPEDKMQWRAINALINNNNVDDSKDIAKRKKERKKIYKKKRF